MSTIDMNEIAAVILAKNESKQIQECIESVRWADRVVVVDTFSTDDTVVLAKAAGAEVYQHRFEHYAQIRNVALETVESPWIFFVDADERATPEIEMEIRQVTSERAENGWWIPRQNYIFGRLTRGAGWSPDYQMRLLRRGQAHYERPVHEIVVLEGKEGHLQNPLIHYNYETVAQFHAKQARYTDLDASILHRQGVRPRIYTPVTQSLRLFFRRFFILKGYLDGLHGLQLCFLLAYYKAVKYHKLKQLWID